MIRVAEMLAHARVKHSVNAYVVRHTRIESV